MGELLCIRWNIHALVFVCLGHLLHCFLLLLFDIPLVNPVRLRPKRTDSNDFESPPASPVEEETPHTQDGDVEDKKGEDYVYNARVSGASWVSGREKEGDWISRRVADDMNNPGCEYKALKGEQWMALLAGLFKCSRAHGDAGSCATSNCFGHFSLGPFSYPPVLPPCICSAAKFPHL